ncbi:MAG: SDR family oxidoreductase [Pseudomonadaceae bacterium]|nr:SDR family oxidoreductase [Pseudomonadaceae bacterium]
MNPNDSRKAAIITGSSGGIGQAICRKFEESGYLVIGIDQRTAEYPKESITLDLSDFDAADFIDKLSSICARYSAGIHAVVNNAALQRLGNFDDLTQADWRDTFEINVFAAVRITQLVLQELISNEGSVINIGSIHAKATKAGFTAYATSKAALRGFTQALAVELGDSIRVNLIEPAAINTPMLQSGFSESPQSIERLGSFHPMNRIGEPNEVAELALFLAEQKAGFINGATIAIDGAIGARLHDPN